MNPWFEMIWSLVSAQFWQVTAVGLIALLLVKTALRRRPHVAYVLLILVILKALVPPLVPAHAPLFNWTWSATPSSPEEPLARTEPVASGSEMVAGTAEVPARAPRASGTEPTETALSQSAWGVTPWLLLAWALGSTATGVFVIASWTRRRRCFYRNAHAPSPKLVDLFQHVSGTVGAPRTVQLLISEQGGPCSFGVFRPTIVLPSHLVATLSRQNLEFILAHELIHIRRRDGLAACFQLAAVILWWFHPLVWLVSRQLSREREKCCDAEVLQSTRCQPASYAQGVLDVLRETAPQASLSLESGFGSNGFTEERLSMIMQRANTRRKTQGWFCWALFTAGMALVLPGGFSSAQPADEPSAPAEDEPRREWARLSPFTRVHVEGNEVRVVYDGTPYLLKSIEGSPTKKILDASREQFGALGEKRFAEDLVEVLEGMGHEVDKTVALELLDPETRKLTQVPNAPMTRKNRQLLYTARLKDNRQAPDPHQEDIAKVRDLIKRFVQAAGEGNADKVRELLLNPRPTKVNSYISSTREFNDMDVEISNPKLVVALRKNGQAFAATDFFPFKPAGGEPHCVVFFCQFEDGEWKLHDIDLEDLEGYSNEYFRFVDKTRSK